MTRGVTKAVTATFCPGDENCADDGTEPGDAFLAAGIELYNVFEVPDYSNVAGDGGDNRVGDGVGGVAEIECGD
jgi:hypothetical protein